VAADRDQRTEAASERQRERAFHEGRVPLGRDAVLVASLGAAAVVTVASGAAFRDVLTALVRASAAGVGRPEFRSLPVDLGRALGQTVLVVAAAAAAAVAATVAQTRGGLWPQLALPDFTRLAKGERLRRLFGRAFLLDLALAAVKAVAVGSAAALALRDAFLTLPQLLTADPSRQLGSLFGALGGAAGRVLLAMAVVAGLDVAVTRFRFFEGLKMTRDEVRRERKEDEGDPLIRARRRRRHRELAKGRAQREVPRADALVVNPVHVAVAIRYRKDEGSAPRVTAKGKGALAATMRDLARANGVPIVEDVPLARLLYKRVKVGGTIPAETYRAVAAVLAWVYRITGRTALLGGEARGERR